MARRSKGHKLHPVVRVILASNVKALRDQKFSQLKNDTARNKALAKAADTTLSQIQRILKCEVGTGIDLLESLAKTFGARPQDLLTPYYAETPPESPDGPPPVSSLPRRSA
jgi:hypothetical protein